LESHKERLNKVEWQEEKNVAKQTVV